MLRRYWITGLAVGLALAGPVQAQDDQQQGGDGEQAETSQPSNLPLPFPVEIIEDPAQQEAREDREDQSDQREKEDLAAQQGMDAATRRMADTADFQASLAVWQTVAVVIGTIVLIATLGLTRRATRAATDSAKYARTGNRPFLHPLNHFLKIEEGRGRGVVISFCADVENIGGGPAFFDRFAAGYFTRGAGSGDGFDVFQLDERAIEWRCFIRAGARREWVNELEGRLPFFVADIPADEWQKIADGWKELLIVGYFSYLDSYGVRWRSGFGFDCRHQMEEHENLAELSESVFWFDGEVRAEKAKRRQRRQRATHVRPRRI